MSQQKEDVYNKLSNELVMVHLIASTDSKTVGHLSTVITNGLKRSREELHDAKMYIEQLAFESKLAFNYFEADCISRLMSSNSSALMDIIIKKLYILACGADINLKKLSLQVKARAQNITWLYEALQEVTHQLKVIQEKLNPQGTWIQTTKNQLAIDKKYEESIRKVFREITENLLCPICDEVAITPKVLGTCGHISCEACLKRLDDVAFADLTASEGGGSARQHLLSRRCPLCRKEIIGGGFRVLPLHHIAKILIAERCIKTEHKSENIKYIEFTLETGEARHINALQLSCYTQSQLAQHSVSEVMGKITADQWRAGAHIMFEAAHTQVFFETFTMFFYDKKAEGLRVIINTPQRMLRVQLDRKNSAEAEKIKADTPNLLVKIATDGRFTILQATPGVVKDTGKHSLLYHSPNEATSHRAASYVPQTEMHLVPRRTAVVSASTASASAVASETPALTPEQSEYRNFSGIIIQGISDARTHNNRLEALASTFDFETVDIECFEPSSTRSLPALGVVKRPKDVLNAQEMSYYKGTVITRRTAVVSASTASVSAVASETPTLTPEQSEYRIFPDIIIQGISDARTHNNRLEALGNAFDFETVDIECFELSRTRFLGDIIQKLYKFTNDTSPTKTAICSEKLASQKIQITRLQDTLATISLQLKAAQEKLSQQHQETIKQLETNKKYKDSVTKVYAQIKEKLTCSICTEVSVCPKVLGNCGHIACEACLNQFSDNAFSTLSASTARQHLLARRCPICRVEIVSDGFPVMHLKNIVDLFNKYIQDNVPACNRLIAKPSYEKISKEADYIAALRLSCYAQSQLSQHSVSQVMGKISENQWRTGVYIMFEGAISRLFFETFATTLHVTVPNVRVNAAQRMLAVQLLDGKNSAETEKIKADRSEHLIVKVATDCRFNITTAVLPQNDSATSNSGSSVMSATSASNASNNAASSVTHQFNAHAATASHSAASGSGSQRSRRHNPTVNNSSPRSCLIS